MVQVRNAPFDFCHGNVRHTSSHMSLQVARHHAALRFANSPSLKTLNPLMWELGGIIVRKDADHWRRVKENYKDSASGKWGLFLSEHPAWKTGDFMPFRPPDDDDNGGGTGSHLTM
jgi:hypothetical protein